MRQITDREYQSAGEEQPVGGAATMISAGRTSRMVVPSKLTCFGEYPASSLLAGKGTLHWLFSPWGVSLGIADGDYCRFCLARAGPVVGSHPASASRGGLDAIQSTRP